MDLLTLKKASNSIWEDLAAKCGIPEANLTRIARGKRGWDVSTALKLRRLGVSIDSQLDVYARAQGLEVPPAPKPTPDICGADQVGPA